METAEAVFREHETLVFKANGWLPVVPILWKLHSLLRQLLSSLSFRADVLLTNGHIM